jgi:hypothetical protein
MSLSSNASLLSMSIAWGEMDVQIQSVDPQLQLQ